MIQLEENKSMIWFKVLNNDGTPIDGSEETWFLPHNDKKGELVTFPGASSRRPSQDDTWFIDPTHKETTWLVSNPMVLYRYNSGLRVFVAQIVDPPVHEEPGMIWVHHVYLLREATNLDLKPFGLYRAFDQVIG